MHFTNHWSSVNGYIMGERLALAMQEAGANVLELGSDDRLPSIEVSFSAIMTPADVVRVGRLIQKTFEADVYFFGLRPHSAQFYLDYDKLISEGARVNINTLNENATPLDAIAEAWGFSKES